jgi:hypothetical protein
MADERCENCRFGQPSGVDSRPIECHRFPPVPDGKGYDRWPMPYGIRAWCGEWQAKRGKAEW